MELEYSLLRQKLQILPYIIVAGIQIISGTIGWIQGIIADGIDDPPHGGILFICKSYGGLLRVFMPAVYGFTDGARQHIGGGKGYDHNGIHTDDQQDTLQQIADDDPHSHALLLIPEITDLPDHCNDGKAKGEYDTDDSHRRINSSDGTVTEENIDKRHILCIIFHRSLAGEDHHGLLHQPYETKDQTFQHKKQTVDQILQHRLKPVFNWAKDISYSK